MPWKHDSAVRRVWRHTVSHPRGVHAWRHCERIHEPRTPLFLRCLCRHHRFTIRIRLNIVLHQFDLTSLIWLADISSLRISIKIIKRKTSRGTYAKPVNITRQEPVIRSTGNFWWTTNVDLSWRRMNIRKCNGPSHQRSRHRQHTAAFNLAALKLLPQWRGLQCNNVRFANIAWHGQRIDCMLNGSSICWSDEW